MHVPAPAASATNGLPDASTMKSSLWPRDVHSCANLRRRAFMRMCHLRTPELGSRERIGKLAVVLLRQVFLHSLEAKIASGLDVIDHNTLGHIAHELGGVQLIVGTARLDCLGLLLDREVGVSVGRVDALLVQVQNLIVRDNARGW